MSGSRTSVKSLDLTTVLHQESVPQTHRERTAPAVALLSTLVLCNQAEWMEAMPTLLAPETLPIAYRNLACYSDSGSSEPRLPSTDSRPKRKTKRRPKLVPIAIPTHANPYAHLPRLKITGRRNKENLADGRTTQTKDKARHRRQVLADVFSAAINAPSLALSGMFRSKEGIDASQTSPPPLGLHSSIGWSSSLSLSRLLRNSTSSTTKQPL
ncbi:hypothetical protein C0995_011989 [Termitomyces sp. Mi166|nr:hypothetical protein C0995_011989 [Termitomyces sp. Mi166\